jgi:predicted nucleic acid-binding Zn ribbon protein
MPTEVRAAMMLLHLIATLFMAAPLYALLAVGERGRFTVPPNYNTDRYLENILKNQPIRCYAYLAVILITGILLTWSRGWIWTDWALIIKLVAFAALASLLSYVHFTIQPHIESILTGWKPGEEVPADKKATFLNWRRRRKRLAGICLFLVLTALIMGVRVTWGYAPWLAAVFVVGAAFFAWRVYRAPVRFGWF